MNRIDASDHYSESTAASQVPSLLTLVIDTNPRAWAALHDTLPISKAIAAILVFVNAHLAFGNDNQVAILAAHPNRAVWLYPQPPNPNSGRHHHHHASSNGRQTTTTQGQEDVEMTDVDLQQQLDAELNGTSANKYPQFAQIEASIRDSLRSLIDSTTTADLHPTTLISGALSTALAHINKTSLAFAPSKTSSDPADPTGSSAAAAAAASSSSSMSALHARILVVSVSDSEPAQYIPTMNAVFAASHARIPVDTLSLYGSPTFLQQAAFITGGTFLSAAANPRGLLSYLMFGFLADAEARRSLVAPTQDSVDFRAACFCHRNVVDAAFVCSICLSIFCEVPQAAECLTCGTRLALGSYGARPAVVPRRKRKKRRINGAGGREETGSATGTPVPT
ncbi:transcription factor Tfb4 [Whalleya microplaca]|nr:transcription factor Tfb4 [Whalleya microplaca]